MEEAVIIGNSGAARECHQLLTDCQWASPTLRFSLSFKGFLSYKGFAGSLGELSSLSLGDMDAYTINAADRFIIGIGKPALRREVYLAMKARGATFMNLISPWSYVPNGFEMGDANIINSHGNFSCGSRIGVGNYFNGGVRLGHDVTIGDFNFFGPSSTVLGGGRIGDANLLAVQSTVLERARVGNANHIAPAAVIFKGCGNNRCMAGNPALPV